MPPGTHCRASKLAAVLDAECLVPLQQNIEPATLQMSACGSEDDPAEKIGVVALRRPDLEHGHNCPRYTSMFIFPSIPWHKRNFFRSCARLNISILIKRDPRSESSEFLLCAPRGFGRSAKFLYRLPHIIERFF